MSLKDTTRSIAETAKILGIAKKTCRKAVECGQIPSIKIGSRRRIVLKFVNALAAGNAAEVVAAIDQK